MQGVLRRTGAPVTALTLDGAMQLAAPSKSAVITVLTPQGKSLQTALGRIVIYTTNAVMEEAAAPLGSRVP
jgi:hypothetical protein